MDEPGFWSGIAWPGIVILAQCLLVTIMLLLSLAVLLWMDRKVWGAVQLRKSINVVGPFGLLQSLMDGLKLAFKEEIIPRRASLAVYDLRGRKVATLVDGVGDLGLRDSNAVKWLGDGHR